MDTANDRPGRPLGVTLAIMLSVFLFSLLPLVNVAFTLRVNGIVYSDEGAFSGVNITGFSDVNLLVQAIMGLVFLLISILAWRGRPASMRFVLVAAVIGLTLIAIMMNVVPTLLTRPDIQGGGIDSSVEVARSLALGQLCFLTLIPSYVIWYMNRAPARAFYRGYYLVPTGETIENG